MKSIYSITIFTLFILIFISFTNSIQIPIKQNQSKCMLLYSMGQDQTFKLDINFPYVKLQNSGNLEQDRKNQQQSYYHVSLTNTVTGQMKQQNIKSHGIFRKQLSIHQAVIYRVCFEFITNTKIIQEIVVDYNADIYYVLNHDKVKIPEHLLKSHQLMNSYQNTIRLHDLADKLIDLQLQRGQYQQRFFNDVEDNDGSFVTIALFEMILICGISFIQLFAVKRYFDGINPAFY